MQPDTSSLYKSPEGHRIMMARYDAALDNLTVPYESLFVPTRHGTTHLITAGPDDAPKIVFFHGRPANAAMWIGEINTFAQDFRVYAVDTLGELGKSAPTRLPLKGPAYGEWAADALENAGIKRARMVGMSNGGWLILKLATIAPQRIASATLFAPAGFVRVNRMFHLRGLIAYLRYPPHKAVDRFLRMLTPPELPVSEEAIESFALLFEHYRHLPRSSPPILSDADLRCLDAPTTIIMGKHDVFNPRAVINRACRVLLNVVSAEILPNAGHMMEGDKQVMNAKIRDFIQQVDASGDR